MKHKFLKLTIQLKTNISVRFDYSVKTDLNILKNKTIINLSGAIT